MYIPDLFGAYIKGRELAIEKNWQDLKNYEQVESARNQNDLQALQILAERADFGGKRSMFRDQVDSSKRGNEVAEYAQPGMVAKADLGSMFAQDQRSVYMNSRPTAQQVMQDMFDAQLGRRGTAAGIQRATNEYWTPERQYEAGQASGQVEYNTTMANGVASTDYVPREYRAIAQNKLNHELSMAGGQYQLRDVQNRLDNQAALHQLGGAELANAQWQQDNYIANQQLGAANAQQAEISRLVGQQANAYNQLAATTDPAARQGLQLLIQQIQSRLAQLGYGQPMAINTQPVQPDLMGQTLIPTPQQQVANAQIAASGLAAQMREHISPRNGMYQTPVTNGVQANTIVPVRRTVWEADPQYTTPLVAQ